MRVNCFLFIFFAVVMCSCDRTIKKKVYDHTSGNNNSTTVTTTRQENSSDDMSTHPSDNKEWKEDAGYGMFYYCEEKNGMISKTLYGLCKACRGTKLCGSCNGFRKCTICGGNGCIVTSGYNQYIPCAACNQTGICHLCKGSGECTCTNTKFPGYIPGSTTLYNSNGTIVSTTSFIGDGGSSSGSSSRSSSGSSHNRRNDYVETVEYAPNYTGDYEEVWCDKCQKYARPHSHIKKPVY